jgi:hypothetical protein
MYTTTPLTITLTAEGSGSSTVVRMPERVKSGTTVTVVNTTTSTTYTGAQVTISSDGRTLTISGVTSPGDVLTVTYTAVRPMPDNSGQMTIFYQTRAPQSVRYASLQPTLSVVPRYISPYLYILTQGPSSPDSGFPFPQAYVQTGGIFKGLSDPNPYLETELSGTASISLADFSARTGMLRVLANVPYTPNPEEVSFNTPGVDGESRSYYSVAQSGVYVPSAFGQVLSYEKRHKVILPMIVELAADTPFARTGTLLLMLITRWASFDNGNFVAFDSNANINTTAASIFRIKGNLLNRGS